MVENREVKEGLDPRYAEIFQKIGRIEGVLDEHEKHIVTLTQSHIDHERNVGATVQRVEEAIRNIQKTLDIASALEKERASYAIERRTQKSTFLSLIPMFKDVLTMIIMIIGALWAIFQILGNNIPN